MQSLARRRRNPKSRAPNLASRPRLPSATGPSTTYQRARPTDRQAGRRVLVHNPRVIDRLLSRHAMYRTRRVVAMRLAT